MLDLRFRPTRLFVSTVLEIRFDFLDRNWVCFDCAQFMFFDCARPMFRLCSIFALIFSKYFLAFSTYVLTFSTKKGYASTVLDICFETVLDICFETVLDICFDLLYVLDYQIRWVNWQKNMLYVFQLLFRDDAWFENKLIKRMISKLFQRKHFFSSWSSQFFFYKLGLKRLI